MRRLWASFVCTASLAVFCGDGWAQGMEPSGPARTQPATDDSAGGFVIQEVVVEGLRRVEREAALQGTRSRVGTPFDPVSITKDLHTLWDTGFFADIRIGKQVVEGGLRIIIQAVEKPSIREVNFVGNDGLSDDDVTGVVDVKPYTILNTELLKRNLVKIKDLYVEKGYYLAEIKYRVDPVVGVEGEVDVTFDIVENAKVMVREISFIGNEALTSDEIKGVIQTREGDELSLITQSGTYKEEFFQTDLFRIQALYYDQGYVAVKVGEPTAVISKDRRFIYLSVPILEGDVHDIGEVGFSGDIELKDEDGKTVVDEAKLRKVMTVKTGDRFHRAELFQNIQALTDIYRDEGYAYANVTPNTVLDSENKLVNLDLEVERGDLVYIGRIEVVGNTRTRDKVVRREVRIVEGEKYSATKINISKARIFQLGYFETVEVSTSRGARAELMDLTLEIKEKSTGTFQIGAGFSSTDSFIATAQIAQNNFLGKGQTLSVSAQLSFGEFARQIFSLQFYEPYFLDSMLSFGLSAYSTSRIYHSFKRDARGGSLSFAYPITPELRVHLQTTLEDIDVDPDIGGRNTGMAFHGFEKGGLNFSGSTSISYDTRDNRLFPSKGHFHLASIEIAGGALVYNKASLFLRYYYPLPLDFVFKTNFQIGYAFRTDDKRVPISERYFLGGIQSIRGYERFALGPVVNTLTTGDAASSSGSLILGGDKQIILNLEVEFPIIEAAGIKGVLFFDVGNAYNEDQNFFYIDTERENRPSAFMMGGGTIPGGPPLGLYYSFGFGFRWFSPIGPLRFEWGIPIVKRATEDRDIIFEFTIGNLF